MHELSLSQSIVDLVAECARKEGMHSVTRVVVEIGVAAGVEMEALKFCFDAVAAGSSIQGATLHIDAVPLAARCEGCGGEFQPEGIVASCPACGSYAFRILKGRELRVKSFDGE